MLGKPFKPVPYQQHIQVPLLPDQVAQVETFSTNELALIRYIFDLVRIGCAVTVKPNDKGGYTSSVQAIEPEHRASGQAIFANAPSPEEAVAVLVFKMETVGPKLDWSVKGGQNTESKYR